VEREGDGAAPGRDEGADPDERDESSGREGGAGGGGAGEGEGEGERVEASAGAEGSSEEAGALTEPKLPKPEPRPLTGIKGECRICFDECDTSELIDSCGCQAKVHYDCCQTWISQDRYIGSKATFCEVCKVEWKYDFHIPEPNTPPPAEQIERLGRILSVSWFRIAMGTAGDREYRFVLSAGRQIQGPWSSWLAERDRKEKSLLHRMSKWWDNTRNSMVRGANLSLEGEESEAGTTQETVNESSALTESSEHHEEERGASWRCCCG